MANTQMISTLVIQFLDLTESVNRFKDLESELRKAYNHEITFIPVIMETISPVYFRNLFIKSGEIIPGGSYKGFEYNGETDDTRAINTFIGKVFDGISNLLGGRNLIIVRYTEEYKKEALRLHTLIKSQELNCVVEFTDSY